MAKGKITHLMNDNGEVIYPITSSELVYTKNGRTTVNEVLEDVKKSLDTIMVNVRDFGATGVGIIDDTRAFQEAFKLAYEKGSVNIYVPAGTYLIDGFIDLYSNTYVKFDAGAKIIKSDKATTSYVFTCGREADKGTTGYGGGCKNVTIEGGHFEGYFDTNIGISFTFNHMQNFKISNAIFYKSITGGHIFDLAGCDNIVIENCEFIGWKPTDGRGFTEVIQIDNSTSDALSNRFSNYDSLPTKNVYVDKCKFLPIYDENNNIIHPAPNPIGSHSYVPSFHFKNINFTNNHVENVEKTNIGTGHTGGGIRFYAIDGLNVVGNKFINTKGFNSYGVSVQCTAIDDQILGSKNINIRDNYFEGFNYGESNVNAVVRIFGADSAFVENIIIDNNEFVNCHGGFQDKDQNKYPDLIYLEKTSCVKVINNKCSIVKKLLRIANSDDVIVQSNTVYYGFYIPISCESVTNFRIDNNYFYGCGCVFYGNSITDVKITNNICEETQDYLSSSYGGVICAKEALNIIVSNNTVKRNAEIANNFKYVYYFYTGSKNIIASSNISVGYGSTVTDIFKVTSSENVYVDSASKADFIL